MKTLYWYEDYLIDGSASWDTLGGLYESEDQAVYEAEAQWNHLTAREQRGREVMVFKHEVPADLDLDNAWDYICDNAISGYTVATFNGK